MFGLTAPLWLSPILSTLGKIPREVIYALIAVAFLLWFGDRQFDRGYDKRTAEYTALIETAQENAAKGSVDAKEAAQVVVDAIAAENARAEAAADGSDDPLKAGMDAL